MVLTDQQLAEFDENGFLVFHDLLNRAEIEALRDEIGQLSSIESDHVVRERTGAARTIFRVHEDNGPTESKIFRALSRSPRVLGPVQQVLRDDDVYIYHSKINTKAAIEGTVWLWHQDYGYWYWDGVPEPRPVTFMVSLEESTEMNGCLYLIPGSHKLGRQEPYADEETTSYKQWTIDRDRLLEILNGSPDPVPIAGQPGMGALFHCNILHASGHNLSATDRWQVYFAFNPVANKPRDVENPRPDYVRSVNWEPIQPGEENAVLTELAGST